MDEVFHSGIELNISVLERAINAFPLGNPALNIEVIAKLICEMQFRSHKEAKTWIFSQVFTELVWNITSGCWLMLDWFPSQLDEWVVHKVR